MCSCALVMSLGIIGLCTHWLLVYKISNFSSAPMKNLFRSPLYTIESRKRQDLAAESCQEQEYAKNTTGLQIWVAHPKSRIRSSLIHQYNILNLIMWQNLSMTILGVFAQIHQNQTMKYQSD